MKRENVSSSNLSSIGYDEENQILEIEFNHGGVYQYFNVPIAEYQGLMSASSHGEYFAANIRNDYRYTKL